MKTLTFDHSIASTEAEKLVKKLEEINFLEIYAKGWMQYTCSADEAYDHIRNGRWSSTDASAHFLAELKQMRKMK